MSQDDVTESIRPYLNEIADRLWAGRAAVMVGAGFSKNASKAFPDWYQLADLFYEKSHGVSPDLDSKKYQNVLRLAEEVQAAIGRPALENLLRSSIPDLSADPSELHVQLLELPWVDVFTTNYDTLLERASASVVTRRYEPVVNKEDIPYAVKPRIVKLHGSFPSERPFIITEEDYRCYPREYAAFVNTVQQALLENTFCLIGFSGDDPNFLEWIGWIRDNLGNDKTQKIYLVGLSSLSSARQQLMAQRGIIFVDLSQCSGIVKGDHGEALKCFFGYLQSRKPNALNWPYNPQMPFPSPDKNRLEEIQKAVEEWQKQRQIYPGWLVLPQDNRVKLWQFTEYWVNCLPNINEDKTDLDIQYVYELLWRFERCLLPIFSNIAELCEQLLKKYESQNNFRHEWLTIALAMLRFYREQGFLDKWEAKQKQIQAYSDYLSEEQKEFLHYEEFLFNLFKLDLPNAKQCLEAWRPNDSQPYWMVKRAGALAEIGQLKEAVTIARVALENIRKKLNQKADALDLMLFSQESNTMFLGRYIQNAAELGGVKQNKSQDKKEQFNERWNDLKAYKCDPWGELKLFKLMLASLPTKQASITEKQTFDIGQIRQTRHFTNAIEQEDFFDAYTFLRFCEELGLPFQIGNFTLATEDAEASLQRILRYSPFWATATMVRLGSEQAVDKLFNRESVHKFTVQEADSLMHDYLNALKKCRDDIHVGNAFCKHNFCVRLAQLLPEVISRLCCKCSTETKYHLLEFITELYASPDQVKYRNVGNLTKRLLGSMSDVEKCKIAPKLLEIPFPKDISPIIEKDFINPFLFLDLEKKPECDVISPYIDPKLADALFQQAELNDAKQRRWAITSLITLYDLKLLDNEQTNKLATIIWRTTDSFGLPDGTDFYKFAFLSFPYPGSVNPSQFFKNYVKQNPFPIQNIKQDKSVAITDGNIPLLNEILGANGNGLNIWNIEDAIEILQHLNKWWNADKSKLMAKDNRDFWFSSVPEEFRSRFARAIEILAEVVGPKLNETISDELKSSLKTLLQEMQDYGLPVLCAEAACLHIYPEQQADIYERINDALISSENSIRIDGVWAIAKLVSSHSTDKSTDEMTEPLAMLSQYLTWSNARGIITALRVVTHILKSSPHYISLNLEKATQKRLEKLISETAYDIDNPDLSFDKKLEIRRFAVSLAAEFYKYYQSRGDSVPDVIEKWHEISLDPDEFAEIRNAWKNYESS